MFPCIGQADSLTGITISVSVNDYVACPILKSEENK